jgi:hypothetical protein
VSIILQPPSVLLLGAPGSGKTDSLITYIEAGLDLFVISTEPDGVGSLIDSIRRRKLPIEKLHYATIIPVASDWKALDDMVTSIGTQNYEQIQGIKSGVGKDKTRAPAIKLLNTFKDFVCERTGESFGSVSEFDSSRALVLDSLSGLSIIAKALTIGYKAAAHQGEWGVMMNFVEEIVMKLTADRKCHFAMTAHVEKELNEVGGITQIMASTLGRKLAPKLPRFFSEVPYAKRAVKDGKPNFTWATADITADLKSRALAVGTDLIPSFVPVVRAYEERLRMTASDDIAPVAAPAAKPTQVAPLPATMTRPTMVVKR